MSSSIFGTVGSRRCDRFSCHLCAREWAKTSDVGTFGITLGGQSQYRSWSSTLHQTSLVVCLHDMFRCQGGSTGHTHRALVRAPGWQHWAPSIDINCIHLILISFAGRRCTNIFSPKHQDRTDMIQIEWKVQTLALFRFFSLFEEANWPSVLRLGVADPDDVLCLIPIPQ